MIVKKRFNPLKVWGYIKGPMWFSIAVSVLAWGIPNLLSLPYFTLHFSLVGTIGSALAIFIAFRNSSAYSRWWEGRQIWGGIVNSSRVFSRLVITFTDSHAHQDNYDSDRSEAFKKSMVLRLISWVHALRLHLRNQSHWEEVRPYLTKEEYERILHSDNKPNYILLLMGQEIYRAMADGTLGGFDSFQMEGQMLALSNYQGSAERIKNTPLPRQYDYFTRLFVRIFTLLLPFGILSFFEGDNLAHLSWLSVVVSILISGVFVIMERTGAANEDPFENQVTDVPLTALCNTIERNLLEVLGEENLPDRLEPVDGYLY